MSWAIIFQRKKAISDALNGAKRFEQKFWSGIDLSKLYNEVSARPGGASGVEALFVAGFKEFARHKKNSIQSASIVM
jgi:biopolymer transport protein TolQ